MRAVSPDAGLPNSGSVKYRPMGKLVRRTANGDEIVLEWSPSDPASVARADAAYRDLLGQDYEAVRSDGTFFAPVEDDAFPVDAAEVVLSTGLGGG